MHSRYPEQLPSPSPASRPYTGISTDRIMRAVEQQRRITDQLESLKTQQQARLARAGRIGPKILVAMFGLSAAVTLGLLFLFVFQPDLFLTIISLLSGFVDVLIQLARYLSTALAFISRESWLLAGSALVLVAMAGLWLRLMRAPREA